MSRPVRLRVVTFLDTLMTGGAERMAVTIATRLDPVRFETTVCVYRPSRHAPLAAELSAAGIPILQLDRGHRGAVWSWKPLLQLLREDRTHVLHSHKSGPNAWGTVLGTLARVPVIVAHEHAGGRERTRLDHTVDREVIGRGADAFVTVTEAHRQWMIEVERVRPEKIRVIRNGIDPLPPVTVDVRGQLGVPPDARVIGTLAVLRPEKALDVLVEAAVLLTRWFPDLHVVLAGEGPEESRLRAFVRQSGLEGRVHFLGFRRDIENVLAALDVAVYCSVREGMPLATIEAMAAGKPIVATAIEGLPELVREGVEGLLVPPRDPQALASAVRRILDDPELGARLGSAALQRQRDTFDIQRTAEAVERLYDEFYARRSRGRGR